MYFLIPCNHVHIARVLAQLPWHLSSMSVVFNRLRTTFKILKVWGNKGTKESGLATHAPTLATISFNTLSHLHVVLPTDASATNYRGVIPVTEHIETLTHWGRYRIAAISQTTFSNAYSWIKIDTFRLRFHWRLFICFELIVFQHFSR